ncbi:hypothetical protein [Convivina intestini]|uniref:hypothetical protein n=1 Tax=Convivina intestini TaxID=1505726 RepID=UPI00200FD5B3|nr:hypothetical protein [Convivina intestini]CAH1855103.1 hypothetical protein R078131_01125 [Convivina intestini]
MKTVKIVIISLIFILFFGSTFYVCQKLLKPTSVTPSTVSFTIGTLNNHETQAWQQLVDNHKLDKINGQSYDVKIQEFDDTQNLASAIKEQKVAYGIGMNQEDITELNQSIDPKSQPQPMIISLAATNDQKDFTGFIGYKGLINGDLIIALNVNSADNQSNKQKNMIQKLVTIYNQNQPN